jgi:hypothetical protein
MDRIAMVITRAMIIHWKIRPIRYTAEKTRGNELTELAGGAGLVAVERVSADGIGMDRCGFGTGPFWSEWKIRLANYL